MTPDQFCDVCFHFSQCNAMSLQLLDCQNKNAIDIDGEPACDKWKKHKDKTRLAIQLIEISKSSHVSWVDYYKRNPSMEGRYEECGDTEFHRRWIEYYDVVLEVLKDSQSVSKEN